MTFFKNGDRHYRLPLRGHQTMLRDTTNYERVRKKFLDQFESDGEVYLYRREMRGMGVPVSAAERDLLTEQYMQRCQRSAVFGGIAIVFLIVALVILGVGRYYWIAGWILFVLGMAVIRQWVSGSVMRAFGDRPRAGENRSWIEAEKLRGRQRKWRDLVLPALLDLTVLHHAFGRHTTEVERAMFLLAGVWILGTMAHTAFRIWQSRRSDAATSSG
jgi:hypothetical protein